MRSRPLRLFTAFLVLLGTVVAVAAPASAADGRPTVEISGHGWGHGWGLGQYGSYGYSKDLGWTSAAILDHYYGGTTGGTLAEASSLDLDPAGLRIDLRSDRGAPTTVELPEGTIRLLAGSDGRSVGAFTPHAVRLRTNDAGDGFIVQIADRCGDPFVDFGEIPGETTVRIVAETTATGQAGLLRYCRSNGIRTSYPGELETVNWTGSTPGHRTVNIVSLEDYLRGVLPKEVPPSWGGPENGPAGPGMGALEAQSVAARSYVMAGDTRYSGTFADSCDTTLCQVYGGWYETTPDGTTTPVVDWRTDAAIATTAASPSPVRLRSDNGKVAQTFFSSSTGGHTSPIDLFSGVPDLGDAVSANPNHEWTVTVDLANFEASAGLGDIEEILVTERNGLSGKWNDGGRVESVEVTFENGSRTYTGSQFRSALRLKSDWFSVGDVLRDGVPANANAKFVDGASKIFLDRAPTADERARWIDLVDAGDRRTFLDELAQSDEWAGALIDDLYRDVLGRGADPAGRDYWREVIASGSPLESVGTWFYGSTEYYNSVGGTSGSFVTSLYERILDRNPDAAGSAHWVDELDRGTATPVDVAFGFYVSPESRQQRTRNMFERLLGRQPDTDTLLYWSGELRTITDLELAVELAMSDEFSNRARG